MQYSINRIKQGTDSFIIDAATGEVKTNGELDREKNDVYIIEVAATDKGTPTQRKTFADMKIDNLDENDNAPYFSESNYVASVEENKITKTTLLTLTASDIDKNKNQELVYSIGGKNPDAKDLFEVSFFPLFY